MTVDEGENFGEMKDFFTVKLDYFKSKAKDAMSAGNYKEAYETYTECLDSLLTGQGAGERSKLLSNRSLAYAKSLNFKAALEDADAAIAISPTFSKAWWRKGTALRGLSRYPDALAAFSESLKHHAIVDQTIVNEHEKIMNQIVERFTREQLAEWIIQRLAKLESRKLLEPAHLETVTSLEMTEAMFCQIKAFNEHSMNPGDYYRFVQHWSMKEMSVPMALVQRASMYRHALCFKQARADAAAALTMLQKDPCISSSDGEMMFTYRKDSFSPYTKVSVNTNAWAWYEMGKAFEGRDEQDADMQSAAKCFAALKNLDTDYPMFSTAFDGLCKSMTDIEAGKALSAVKDQFGIEQYGLRTLPESMSATHVVTSTVLFQGGALAQFNSNVRDEFRRSVALGANVRKEEVLIEKVHQRSKKNEAAVAVTYRIFAGQDKLNAEKLLERIESKDIELLGGAQTREALGSPQLLQGEINELKSEDFVDRINSLQGIILSNLKSGKEIVVASRPPKDMELPYRTYKLVHGDGTPVERVNKTMYQMSQVHYTAQGMDKREVWAEMMDKSCRWHQSSSEIAIQALQVPSSAKKDDMDVCITSSTVRVSCKHSGKTFLEGELFRPIIPEESAWVHLGGVDDDGFVLYLKKMNLELFKSKNAQPSDSWWERLFNTHGSIAFDDYDKDFTDLPAPVAERIAASEAESNFKNMLDDTESRERETARERDELRKRNRQVRLAELRGGKFLSWVELDRRNPAANAMST